MRPNAKSRFSSFLNTLNTMIPDQEENNLQLLRIKKEAEKMKSDNPAEAFALLGMVSCIEGNIKETRSNHENALRYENSLRQKGLYATSLFRLNLFNDAYKYFAEIHTASGKINLIILDCLLCCTFFLNKDDEFDKYSDLWVKLTPDNHPLIYNENSQMNFLEDDDRYLKRFLGSMDRYIEDNPGSVQELDMDMFELAEELVAGVEI